MTADGAKAPSDKRVAEYRLATRPANPARRRMTAVGSAAIVYPLG